MTSLKLTIEYDGTDFSGWQSQPNGRTVQDELESAIAKISGKKIRIIGAGRTDAGVHATGQVASVRLENPVSAETFKRNVNGVLPKDIVVRDASIAPEGFHARYDARSRSYTYTLMMRPTALMRRRAWTVGWDLNTSYLTRCAEFFIGTHDFKAFSKVGSDVSDWECTVDRSEWRQTQEMLVYEVRADRFMYGMVRAMVGTMIEIGRSYRPIEDLEQIFQSKDRSHAGMAAPPHGLCLVHVEY